MQRIILFLVCFLFKAVFADYKGYVSFVAIDTYTGNKEMVLLVPGESSYTVSKKFFIKTRSVEFDENYREVTWIDLSIYYKANDCDDYQIIQEGILNNLKIYRFFENRYVIAFDVSDAVNEN